MIMLVKKIMDMFPTAKPKDDQPGSPKRQKQEQGKPAKLEDCLSML